MHRTSHRAGVYRTIIIVRLVRIGYVEQSRQNDRCFGMLLAVISLSLSHGHMLRWLSLKSVLSARHLVGSRKTHVFLNIVRKHWSTKAVDFGIPLESAYATFFHHWLHICLISDTAATLGWKSWKLITRPLRIFSTMTWPIWVSVLKTV